MTIRKYIDEAIEIVGLQKLAAELGISYQSMIGWKDRNRMPDSEYSCRTRYAEKIQKLTNGKVKQRDILGCIPNCPKRKK